ncbi:hypothetical protein NKH77_06605 [Streptomyces sp. M19]
MPAALAVIVLDRLPGPGAVPPAVPPEFLTRFDQRPGCLVVPDPDRAGGRGPWRGAARSPGGPRPDGAGGGGARSLRWASEAAALVRRGVLPLPDSGLLRCADHLATLLLFRDECLVRALADRHLAPLAGCPSRSAAGWPTPCCAGSSAVATRTRRRRG